jgi:RNA polymerase sigma-70 factor, ECF subfamily
LARRLNVASNVDFATVIVERRTVDVWTEDSGDAALVNAAREGDRAAFGLLYDRYAPMVHGVLLARVPYGAVDDLVQDVFLQALGRLRALRNTSSFGGWIAAIARNRAHDYHRQSRNEVELTDDVWGEDRATSGAATSQSAGTASAWTSAPAPDSDAAAALAAIRSLPEAYRETLILRLVEGMTGPEIAARTGLTRGSVRVNLHRGMQQLREKLGGRL